MTVARSACMCSAGLTTAAFLIASAVVVSRSLRRNRLRLHIPNEGEVACSLLRTYGTTGLVMWEPETRGTRRQQTGWARRWGCR
jgi:hypothetical protein